MFNPLCLLFITTFCWHYASSRHIVKPNYHTMHQPYFLPYSGYGYPAPHYSPYHQPYQQPYHTPLYSPPGTYFDYRLGIFRHLPGGGMLKKVNYHERCLNNYLGIKADEHHPRCYFLCRIDSVVHAQCQNFQIFNKTSGQCVQHPPPENTPTCHGIGSFPFFSDCHHYYKCEEDMIPKICSCPAYTVFSATSQKCISGNKCTPTQISPHGSNIPENCADKFPPCYENGVRRSPSDCSLYYKCELQKNGKFLQTRLRCNQGYFYHMKENKCLPAKEVPCDCIQVAELVYPLPNTIPFQPAVYPQPYYYDTLQQNHYPVEQSKEYVNTNCDVGESKNDKETEKEHKERVPLTVPPIMSESTEHDDSEVVVLADYIDIDSSNNPQSEELDALSTEGSGSEEVFDETTTLSPNKEDSTEPDKGSTTLSPKTEDSIEPVSEEPISINPGIENTTEADDNETEEVKASISTTESTEEPEKQTEKTSTDDEKTTSTNNNQEKEETSTSKTVFTTEDTSISAKPEPCENIIEGDESNDKPLPIDTSQKQTKTCSPKLTTSSTDTDSDVTITTHNLEVSRGSRSTIHEQNPQTITTVSPITPTTQKTTLVSENISSKTDSPEATTSSSPEATTTDKVTTLETTTQEIPTTLKPPIDGTTDNPTDFTIGDEFTIFDSDIINDFETSTKASMDNFEREELLPLTPQQTGSSKGPDARKKSKNGKSATLSQADFADEEFLPVDSKFTVQNDIPEQTTDFNFVTDGLGEDYDDDFSTTTTIADKEDSTTATPKEKETTETVKSETKEDEKPTTSIKRREISQFKTTELDTSTPSSENSIADEMEEGSADYFEDFIRVPNEEVSNNEITSEDTTENTIEISTSKQLTAHTPSNTLTPTQTPSTTPKNIQSEPCEKHSDTLVIHVREEEHEQPSEDSSSSKSLYYILKTKPVINNNTTTNINNDTKSCNGTVAAPPCIQPNDGRIPILEILLEKPVEVRLSVCPPKCRNDHKHNYLPTSNRAVSLKWFANRSNQTLGFETANEIKTGDTDC